MKKLLVQYYGIVQNLMIKMTKKVQTRGNNIAIDFAHKLAPACVNSKNLNSQALINLV